LVHENFPKTGLIKKNIVNFPNSNFLKELKMPFIKAKEGPPNICSTIYTVQYFDEDENIVIT
jgi:hypothetical protein